MDLTGFTLVFDFTVVVRETFGAAEVVVLILVFSTRVSSTGATSVSVTSVFFTVDVYLRSSAKVVNRLPTFLLNRR